MLFSQIQFLPDMFLTTLTGNVTCILDQKAPESSLTIIRMKIESHRTVDYTMMFCGLLIEIPFILTVTVLRVKYFNHFPMQGWMSSNETCLTYWLIPVIIRYSASSALNDRNDRQRIPESSDRINHYIGKTGG